MTEVSFAQSFLAILDSRPVKLSPDHVEDPRSYPARSAYTLPKMPRPMSKRRSAAAPAAPGQEPAVAVSVRPLQRNHPAFPPDAALRLPGAQTRGTPLLDVKAAVAAATGIPADRLKLLHKRRPVSDTKVLGDLLGAAGDGEMAVELSVMVMGGGGAATAATNTAASPAAGGGADDNTDDKTAEVVAQGGPSGADVLGTPVFWDDLRGFLLQRVRDERLAGELSETFQAAWKAKR
ncbi:hypothetical protein DL762_005742 [Monosporascus cannonballus]|uniref:Ubiquitin-like domain-containing protein n=1 Tax=Monosporascus cannonballus TaxID=155416 RepID=A0ABY0H8A6_9PEZI|nr:hypothetical protein DL762_005742 [Monosporascus cannonballus]